jgi:threonine/homoserine/homoserine lactone efflux protein
MIFKGFKFGMLLQLAVGPICLYIFQTAVAHGFSSAMSGVLGVTLVDTLFILLAIGGLGKLLESQKNLKKLMGIFGALVLIGFGLSTLLGAFGISLVPRVTLLATGNFDSRFLQAVVLTLSNPLTILFWAGVFSARIIDDDLIAVDLYAFGLGAVISTVFFLTVISVTGHYVSAFLPSPLLTLLNMVIGLVLIAFGIKPALRKPFPD